MFQQNLIGMQGATMNTPSRFLPPLQQARASGPIEEFKFTEIKPKKQLKEIRKVLLPEKKKFLFFKYSMKYNLKDRCIVCGVHHVWDSGDFMRPPIPLSEVTKGRPLRATYCAKHSSTHRQLEMLQQQILADEHGLDFKAFVPRPKMPQILKKGPINNLTKDDVMTLTSAGWIIKPPALKGDEPPLAEMVRLSAEMQIMLERFNALLKGANNTGE